MRKVIAVVLALVLLQVAMLGTVGAQVAQNTNQDVLQQGPVQVTDPAHWCINEDMPQYLLHCRYAGNTYVLVAQSTGELTNFFSTELLPIKTNQVFMIVPEAGKVSQETTFFFYQHRSIPGVFVYVPWEIVSQIRETYRIRMSVENGDFHDIRLTQSLRDWRTLSRHIKTIIARDSDPLESLP